MPASITRREFGLTAFAGIAFAATGRFAPPAYAADGVDLQVFTALSQELTGAAGLDAGIAAKLLGGLVGAGQGPALAALVAGQAPRDGKDASLANAIVGAWYSGIYETPKGPAVATFDQALLWNALSFTKPFGECGGETGYWGDPPHA